MSDKVVCRVLQSNGKYKKYKSINGANFTAKDGKSYNAPNAENYEILEESNFLGRRRLAFYRQGEPDAIPLNKKGTWQPAQNHDRDVDMLVKVTREAIMEAKGAEMKQNATLAGIGFVIVLAIIIIMMV